MSNTAFARRLISLRVLALSCAAALAGCSILPGQEGGASEEPPPSTAAPGQPAPEPAEQTPAQAQEQTQALEQTQTQPGWNLQTLESTPLAAAPDGLTLEAAWRLAMAHDAEYHAALSGRAAARTEARLGRAAILPQVQAGYSRNKITGLQRNFTQLGVREGDLDYDSTSAYIQLQQPLFNMDGYATYLRGKERVRLGEAEFALQEVEAALRLTETYLDAVAAQGRSELAQALADSLAEQARTQEALFKENEASVVDAQETRARLALAQAELLRAQDEERVARRSLQALIGPGRPDPLGVDGLEPDEASLSTSLVHWLQRAEANGAAVRVADARTRVADTEVSRARARHLPTATLVVALADADSENLDSLSQRSNTFQLGVNVAIPIFSGGYDTANHARSRHERRQAEHELAQAREQVAAEVTRHYTAVQGGAQRIDALRSSLRAGDESLMAAQKGYEYGIYSNLDVLRRQDSVFQARQELLQARVTWLQARTAMALTAGEPVAAVLAAVDRLLAQ